MFDINSIDGYVFDLDGTLYDFEGVTFSCSRLGKKVKENYYRLIEVNRLGDPKEIYSHMIEIEQKEGTGLSLQLAMLLGKTRGDVIKETWGNVNPQEVVQNFQPSQEVIHFLSWRRKTLFLVTAAPEIWAEKVLEYLIIKPYFSGVFTLENLGETKKDIFSKLQEKSGIIPERLISVGDQEWSDIIPAQELGMKTLLVQKPSDLYKLINNI